MSHTPRSIHEPMPTDPLDALGTSLFLHVLSHLPFPSLLAIEGVSRGWQDLVKNREKTIWRSACHRTGVEREHMAQLEMIERALAQPAHYGWEDGEEEPVPPDEPLGSVGWRNICKSHVALDRNWRFGRCRERYLTPPGNSVWRIKVDAENQVLLASDRTGGVTVTDCKTSAPIFEIGGVRPFAHLEFAKGFAVFDTGNEFALEVWRTQQAIGRSSRKTTKAESPLSATLYSHTHPEFTKKTRPLPRGHLAFYRRIVPSTPCIAFRARVDHEGDEGNERAVLGTAGEEAVYIWDLEEEGRVETIPTGLTEERIQYIEFDEEYVFICSQTQMHVFSRSTQKKVMTFPPTLECTPLPSTTSESSVSSSGSGTETPWALSFKFDLLNDVDLLPRQSVGQNNSPIEGGEYYENWMASKKGHEDYPGVQEGQNPATGSPGRLLSPRDFSACHFTENDLYCTARSGHVVIVRDYKTAFAAPEEDRAAVVASQTILLDITTPAELLTTSKDRVAISTSNRVIILDTTTLPSLPFSHPVQPVRFNIVLSTCYDGVRMAACVQIDRANIYHTYWALGEVSLGGIKDPLTGQRRMPPMRALDEFGMCVKVWDFTPWEK